MGIFERYLSIWVSFSIVIGVILGGWQPDAFKIIADLEIAHVNIVVAVAISLFGLHSGAALATVVEERVEVPVMLSLVYLLNRTKSCFGETHV